MVESKISAAYYWYVNAQIEQGYKADRYREVMKPVIDGFSKVTRYSDGKFINLFKNFYEKREKNDQSEFDDWLKGNCHQE